MAADFVAPYIQPAFRQWWNNEADTSGAGLRAPEESIAEEGLLDPSLGTGEPTVPTSVRAPLPPEQPMPISAAALQLPLGPFPDARLPQPPARYQDMRATNDNAAAKIRRAGSQANWNAYAAPPSAYGPLQPDWILRGGPPRRDALNDPGLPPLWNIADYNTIGAPNQQIPGGSWRAAQRGAQQWETGAPVQNPWQPNLIPPVPNRPETPSTYGYGGMDPQEAADWAMAQRAAKQAAGTLPSDNTPPTQKNAYIQGQPGWQERYQEHLRFGKPTYAPWDQRRIMATAKAQGSPITEQEAAFFAAGPDATWQQAAAAGVSPQIMQFMPQVLHAQENIATGQHNQRLREQIIVAGIRAGETPEQTKARLEAAGLAGAPGGAGTPGGADGDAAADAGNGWSWPLKVAAGGAAALAAPWLIGGAGRLLRGGLRSAKTGWFPNAAKVAQGAGQAIGGVAPAVSATTSKLQDRLTKLKALRESEVQAGRAAKAAGDAATKAKAAQRVAGYDKGIAKLKKTIKKVTPEMPRVAVKAPWLKRALRGVGKAVKGLGRVGKFAALPPQISVPMLIEDLLIAQYPERANLAPVEGSLLMQPKDVRGRPVY